MLAVLDRSGALGPGGIFSVQGLFQCPILLELPFLEQSRCPALALLHADGGILFSLRGAVLLLLLTLPLPIQPCLSQAK